MTLPFAPPIEPMLARIADSIPEGAGWHYEPKWDGFRALVFADDGDVYLQSRDLKPLARYFPELQSALAQLLTGAVVLDGEIVIVRDGGLDFDALLMRIHPAESRVRRLAAETPASFIAFDLLAEGQRDLRGVPFAERRRLLTERLTGATPPLYLTPATEDHGLATTWFQQFEGAGLDGLVARRDNEAYLPGVRAMRKIKHLRTADCVVGGLRWAKGEDGRAVGSLLLGLYDDAGALHYVGHTSSFKSPERRELAARLSPLISTDAGAGFGEGRTPGGPSRWTGGRETDWVRLRPELVCEVTFDHLQGERFRHASALVRWRPDREPRSCTFGQLESTVPYEFRQIFAG